MNKDELRQKIKSIPLEEIDEFHAERSEYLEDGVTREVPDDIDFEEYSLEEILAFEKNRLMNLVSRCEYYYAVLEGWNRARYCECGADNYYECTKNQECSDESKVNRLKYVKQKREEMFNVNERLMTIQSLGWKLSGIEQSEKLADNFLQGLEHYPMLRKKIALMTGKAVQNFSEDFREKHGDRDE